MSHGYNGVHSWLLEYINKCESGDIMVGRELMMMLNILKGHFNNPLTTVDFADAHKRIKFIETKVRHFEAPFAGQPFILELFQKAFLESIYSFKLYDEEAARLVRLYQEVLFLVSRKCGKTPLIGATGLAEFFCGPMGLKILCSSNDYDQAALMFDGINNMREESPSLEKVTRKNIRGIYFGNPKRPKKKGKFSYQNKGSIRKISAKTKAQEGRNIGIGLVDEVHELKDNSSIMPIRQALSTQVEPLYIELTTEGMVADGYLDQRLKEARQVLAGELDRPRWLIWLYTQDNEAEVWQDERTWVKSNPGLGTIKKWSFLRGMVEEAKTSTATRIFVLAKDFNIKQSAVSANAWLTEPEYWNEATFNIDSLRGAIALGGVDLAESVDLCCAKAMVMRPGDPTKYIITKYFIPETKISQGSIEDKKDYLEWAKQGLITVSPGNENDFQLITKWYVDLYKSFGIRTYKVGYDNAMAKDWVREMSDTGFEMERIPQDKQHLSGPMKLCEADLKQKLVNYNANPITKWCLSSTGVKVDKLGLIIPVKMQENMRIDGTAALLICYAVYMSNRSDYLDMLR